MIATRLTAFLFAIFSIVSLEAKELPPLTQAHAHNDYEHKHPLFDAVSHGFASVEADIWLVDGQLLVAHERKKLKPENTLQALYLDPLRARAKKFGGKIYPATNFTFHLLIDFKTSPTTMYPVLRQVLSNYSDIITTFDHDRAQPKAVTVVLTGGHPKESVLEAEPLRYAGIDGKLADLAATNKSPTLLWISDNWENIFKWRGHGPIPANEQARLKEIAAQTHERKLLLRFWGAPDSTNLWKELKADGVDLLNADNLAGLEKFLRKN